MDTTLSQSLAAFVSSVLGAVLAVSIGVSHRQLCALISFAAGVLLSVTFFHILPEAWNEISKTALVVSLASGYGLFYVISKYVSHVCPACAASHFEHQPVSRTKNVSTLLAAALLVHNLMDGAAIALGHEMSDGTGHSIFFTVAIHKLPEGLALCALLLRAGNSRNKAFFMTLLLEMSTLVGWALGSWMLEKHISLGWLNLVMVHIAGGFLYLALHAAINEAKDHSPKLVFVFFLVGFLFMALVR